MNILLAEDNLINQKFALRALQMKGHNVEVANNGVEAINLWQDNEFDLILMDVQMDPQDIIDTAIAITDVLQTHAVDPTIANRYACAIRHKPNPAFVDAYGVGNILRMANHDALDPNSERLAAIDLRTKKPNGKPWDFRNRSDRQLVYRLINELKPDRIIGAPRALTSANGIQGSTM